MSRKRISFGIPIHLPPEMPYAIKRALIDLMSTYGYITANPSVIIGML